MNIRIFGQRAFAAAFTAAMSVLSIQSASAAPLAITDTPLFLMAAVKPNLIMAIDDSGSMDAEVLMRGNDGMAWWRAASADDCTAAIDNSSFTGCLTNADGTKNYPGAGNNINATGAVNTVWRKFAYLFPNGSGTNTQNKRRLSDSGESHWAVPPLAVWGWSRSPDYNRAYFDPTTTYSPWPQGGYATAFANADPTATEYDPVYKTGGAAPINLTQDYAGMGSVATTTDCASLDATTIAADYGFRVYTGMTIPENTCIRPSGGVWTTVRPGGSCRVGVANQCLTGTTAASTTVTTVNDNTAIGVRYFPATFYVKDLMPAAYGYTATPTTDAKSPDGLTTLYRYEIKRTNFVDQPSYDAAIQNFANWFMYYRKRHMALRAGLGNAFLSLQGTRVAGFRINEASGSPPTAPDVSMLDVDVAANRTALYNNFYYNWTGDGPTPNRKAVANVIRNFNRSGANVPVTHSCQRNFGMLFTDGYTLAAAANDGINGVAGNADGAEGSPYADTTADTMADAAMKAYKTPLAGGTYATGKVIVPSACSTTPLDPRLDCNKNLHMNFYAVTLGARGLRFDADNPVDPYKFPPTWPTTFPTQHPSAVDDLWHATINGRGQLLNASSSVELADKLASVLRSIIERVGSASSAAVNSGSINSDTRLFQASFDSKDWSGKLTGREVNLTGTLGTEVLGTIPAASARQIVTVNSNGVAVPFQWASLDTTRQGQLDADGFGAGRLEWLRGDQSDEAPTGKFRKRTSLLGDIINSAPAFVGSPAFRYPDTLESAPYSTFRTNNLSRVHMVYAGANDGMLHAFYSDDVAANGVLEERFAFVPPALFGNLSLLSAPNYSHKYFADGSPVTGDAFVGGSWRTMLVAGLNKGGQAVYALDITDPAALTEANATTVFKWQYSDAQDIDMGYTYSRPSIVRMNDGGWAAGFGNGYNNTVADGRQSTTGNAVLYIVNLDTGAQIAKIDTGVGTAQDPTGAARPNGLSTPVFVDMDGDSDVDLAYAGDLFGNLWKFDLSSSAPGSWSVANGAPLFVAKNADNKYQPITSRPNVSRGINGAGLIVVFGTGKYLEAVDTDTTYETASFYGLLDPNKGDATDKIASRANLKQQTITNETTAGLRVTSANTLGATDRGWYIDLLGGGSTAQGEMQVTDSLIRNGHVVFTTLVPNVDPCEFGGSSWLMEMNLFTGGRLTTTPFDLNNNELFDDTVTISGTPYSVSGVKTTVGITPKPAPLSGEKCDYLIFPGTSGGTETRCRDPGPRGSGRQSWRQAH